MNLNMDMDMEQARARRSARAAPPPRSLQAPTIAAAARAASIPTSPARQRGLQPPAHGHRLACFRPRQRFSHRALRVPAVPVSTSVVCGCASRVLPCRLGSHTAATATATASATAEDKRLLKWMDKFDAQDWDRQERVCQKWKEYQDKYRTEEAAALSHAREVKKKHRQKTQTNGSRPTTVAMEDSMVVILSEDVPAMVLRSDDGEDARDVLPAKTAGLAVKNAFTSLASAAEGLLLSSKFDQLLRAGVPPHLRGRVWWQCSGAADKRRAASSLETYQALVARVPQLSKRAALEIEKDLPRTFPTDPQRADERELCAANTAELRRVLQAYSLRNPVVGYCQSMNFLAAMLLQQLEEEDAFWVLTAVVEDLIPQYHTRIMVGSRAEQRVLAELVQQKLPLLDQHVRALGVDFEPFTLKWFLCLFVNTLPLESALRVWDVFFCEGSHVLVRVGLTLLKLTEPRILACDDPIDVYELFKFAPATLRELTAPHRSGLLNRDECVCDTLIRLAMDKSFLGPIAFDTLHALRQLYRNEVSSEMKALHERRARRNAAGRISSRGSSMETDHDAGDGEGEDEEEGSGSEDENEEQESMIHGRLRHEEAARELNEYDFVEEYAFHCGDVSPTKHIHFRDLYESSDATDYFIDVAYHGHEAPSRCQ